MSATAYRLMPAGSSAEDVRDRVLREDDSPRDFRARDGRGVVRSYRDVDSLRRAILAREARALHEISGTI